MKHTKYSYLIAGDVVDQNIVLVRDKLSGAFHTPWAAELRMIGQAARFFLEKLIQG